MKSFIVDIKIEVKATHKVKIKAKDRFHALSLIEENASAQVNFTLDKNHPMSSCPATENIGGESIFRNIQISEEIMPEFEAITTIISNMYGCGGPLYDALVRIQTSMGKS